MQQGRDTGLRARLLDGQTILSYVASSVLGMKAKSADQQVVRVAREISDDVLTACGFTASARVLEDKQPDFIRCVDAPPDFVKHSSSRAAALPVIQGAQISLKLNKDCGLRINVTLPGGHFWAYGVRLVAGNGSSKFLEVMCARQVGCRGRGGLCSGG